ncbi:MAG: V-type ATP synthase subunit F [Candidatus Nanohaloarchaea archaeon]
MVDKQMKKKIAVIGDSDFTTGFRLAGVQKIYGKEDYANRIQELLEREDIGILVVEQEDLEELPARIRTPVEESVDPVVVPLSESGTQEQINEKIRKVIGADIT